MEKTPINAGKIFKIFVFLILAMPILLFLNLSKFIFKKDGHFSNNDSLLNKAKADVPGGGTGGGGACNSDSGGGGGSCGCGSGGRRLGTAVLAIAGHEILLLPAVLIVAVIVASNKLKMSLLKFRILIGSIVLIALFLGAGFIFRHQLSDVFTNLAQAKILSLNFDSAKIYLTMAKIINKNNPNYYFLAGNINFLENNFDDAIKNYNIAIGLGYQPEAYVLISRASAYLKINNYDSAISDYMTLYQNPSDSFTVQRLAIAYMEADRGKDAVSVIERLIGEVESQKVSASDESKAGLYNLLGGAYYLDRNFKKAADAYNKSLKLISNFWPLLI